MAAPQIPPRSNGVRQDMFVVRLLVAGNSWGIWDKKTGGEYDSDEVKYYPGGMNKVVSLGGRQTPGNITLQRLYDRIDDNERINTLLNGVGKISCTVSQRPMDLDGNGVGKTVYWTGKLKRVLVPDVDSEATSAALVEVEITVDGAPQAK